MKNSFFTKKLSIVITLLVSLILLSSCIYRKDAYHIFDKFLVLDNVSLPLIFL